jgi:hypothetical protein
MLALDELEVYTLAQEFTNKIWFIVEKSPSFPIQNELINELKIIHKKLNGYIKFLRKSYLDSNRKANKPINE